MSTGQVFNHLHAPTCSRPWPGARCTWASLTDFQREWAIRKARKPSELLPISSLHPAVSWPNTDTTPLPVMAQGEETAREKLKVRKEGNKFLAIVWQDRELLTEVTATKVTLKHKSYRVTPYLKPIQGNQKMQTPYNHLEWNAHFHHWPCLLAPAPLWCLPHHSLLTQS